MITVTSFQIPFQPIDSMKILPDPVPACSPGGRKVSVDIVVERSTVTSANLSMIRIDDEVVAGAVLTGLARNEMLSRPLLQKIRNHARHAKLRV